MTRAGTHEFDVDVLVDSRIGSNWCLFVDRDGVINRRVVGDYVRSWEQFEFLPGAEQALVALSRWAPHVVVVTNQQGVGKHLLTAASLTGIHRHMSDSVVSAGGRIDGVLTCTHLATERCACRKPAPGLALTWLAEHPDVDGALSIMVGDTDSDMEMAERLAATTGGCAPVRIGPTDSSLQAFADAVESARHRMTVHGANT